MKKELTIKRNGFYLFKGSLPDNITAGFTGKEIPGLDPPGNMLEILGELGANKKIAWMAQKHSWRVKMVQRAGHYSCDGIFTENKRLVLIVKSADCLPLIFCHKSGNSLGVVHMGWRSAEAGILEKLDTGHPMSGYTVIAGPGLRPCCYEVGEEFLSHKNMAPFITQSGGKYIFDPISFSHKKLTEKGLIPKNFHDLSLCSKCSGHVVHSNRRDGTKDRTLNFIFTNDVTE
ncbi:MAG: polyphenol oxidase family protein [Candidatus Omnitrophica bacterium]|nr:polyphenol oxidase family protein [Candidatus Omnitrophota bacterium]